VVARDTGGVYAGLFFLDEKSLKETLFPHKTAVKALLWMEGCPARPYDGRPEDQCKQNLIFPIIPNNRMTILPPLLLRLPMMLHS
jgi:hypothetical protein